MDAKDVHDISKRTDKEYELFDYAGVLSYLKFNNKTSNKNGKSKNNFEIKL